MPTIGRPPRTHLATLPTTPGETVAFDLHPKTNRLYLKSASAWKFAYRGTTPPASLPTIDGDDGGVTVPADTLKCLTVSTGTDQIAGLQLIVEGTVADQPIAIEVEE
tara:strand:- start:619 stop:939 length:321 start_codon:yes stop_codon:yes gene_type:complete